MSQKIPAGMIVVAKDDFRGRFGEHEIVQGSLYIVGYTRNLHGEPPSYWVVNELGVNSVYPQNAFERATIRSVRSSDFLGDREA